MGQWRRRKCWACWWPLRCWWSAFLDHSYDSTFPGSGFCCVKCMFVHETNTSRVRDAEEWVQSFFFYCTNCLHSHTVEISIWPLLKHTHLRDELELSDFKAATWQLTLSSLSVRAAIVAVVPSASCRNQHQHSRSPKISLLHSSLPDQYTTYSRSCFTQKGSLSSRYIVVPDVSHKLKTIFTVSSSVASLGIRVSLLLLHQLPVHLACLAHYTLDFNSDHHHLVIVSHHLFAYLVFVCTPYATTFTTWAH